jgi:molybdopterin/thiamine biosynthesis adenylyltransferase
VDPDRVEPQNVARQAFDRREVGRFKAEVLAERLARRFERAVGYSVLPYDRQLHASVFGDAARGLRLLVGCVDNAAARRAIATTLHAPSWSGTRSQTVGWLDAVRFVPSKPAA